MMHQVDSLYDYPIQSGRFLVEASAGTGKTYTIAELYRRLIVERGLRPRDILVVTFSKAAAAELKERLQKKLAESLTSGWTGADGQTVLPDAGIQLRLSLAEASFDEACIFTIHSFCQKMLTRYPVEADIKLNQALIPSEDEYRDAVLRDFWRAHAYGAAEPPPFTFEQGRELAKMKLSSSARIFCDESDPEQIVKRDFSLGVNDGIAVKKNADSVLGFDDLVDTLAAALDGPNGKVLSERIRSRYRAVFVDEFQDTDLAQFTVFDRCFPMGSDVLMYLIGDPKQAIYGFRGADIYAYLQAKHGIAPECCFTLAKNFRSSPDHVNAVDRLFTAEPPPEQEDTAVFGQPDIPFIRIVSGKKKSDFLLLEHGNPVTRPIRYIRVRGAKSNLTRGILDWTVSEIRRLLSPDADIRLLDAERGLRPLEPSDIAVLTETNATSALLVRRLTESGVNASAGANTSVYFSDEAEELTAVLHAILSGTDTDLRRAMISPFYRLPAAILDRFVNPDPDDADAVRGFDRWRDYFQSFRPLWDEHGFFAMFQALFDGVCPDDAPARTPRLAILNAPSGERAITNCLQLAELLNLAEQEATLRPDALLEYLTESIRTGGTPNSADTDDGADPASTQLRLDRDTRAVRVLTSFGSKGLEFPIVFLPFPSSFAADVKDTAGVLKVRTEQGLTVDFRTGSTEWNTFQSSVATPESLKSQMRLLYVSLTRGKYLTYLTVPENLAGARSNATNFLHTALGVLTLARSPEEPGRDLYSRALALPPGPLAPDALAPWLNPHCPLTCECSADDRYYGPVWQEKFSSIPLIALPPPTVPHSWRIASFSSLQKLLTASAADDAEAPRDVDEESGMIETPSAPPADAPATQPDLFGSTPEQQFHAFPAGIEVGLLIHEILQRLAMPPSNRACSFRRFADPDWKTEPELNRLLRTTALRYSTDRSADAIGTRIDQLHDCLRRALTVPLPPTGVPLCRIEPGELTAELEFFLRVDTRVRPDEIPTLLAARASDRVKSCFSGRRLPRTGAQGADGLLTGSIDLVYRLDGKYYLVDWKTNRLGDSDAAYTSDSIRTEMIRGGYLLQYHLYTAALVRLLRQRDPGFTYERDFGGVQYLFLRGVGPGGAGVWTDRPPETCINALLHLFQPDDASIGEQP